jgi:hypothetical protein
MIDNFNEFKKSSSINENDKKSMKKLFKYIENDEEVKNGILGAIQKAGKDIIHAFLYDLSDDSSFKDYNNSKNRARKIIARNKEREAEELKKELIKNKKEEVEKNLIKQLGMANYKTLSRSLRKDELIALYDIVKKKPKTKGPTKASADDIEIIKHFSKSEIESDDVDKVIDLIKKRR